MISIIFWGSTIVSILFAVIAILTLNWRYMILSAFLYYPLVWYLNATPRFEGTLLLYAFHFLIAFSVQSNRKLIWLAWVSLVPIIAFPLWIVFLVINQ